MKERSTVKMFGMTTQVHSTVAAQVVIGHLIIQTLCYKARALSRTAPSRQRLNERRITYSDIVLLWGSDDDKGSFTDAHFD